MNPSELAFSAPVLDNACFVKKPQWNTGSMKEERQKFWPGGEGTGDMSREIGQDIDCFSSEFLKSIQGWKQ